jgi:dihydroflavonol-4-reductase
VFVSCSEALPELPNGQVISEVDHFEAAPDMACYAKTKAMASQLVLDAVHRNPWFDAVIVHPTAICGPCDYEHGPMTSFVLYAAKGAPITIPGNFNSVDVRDLAAGILAAAEKGRRGECYIFSNVIKSVTEIIYIVQTVMHRFVRSIRLPLWLTVCAASVSGFCGRLLHTRPILTKYSLYNLLRNNNYSSEKARRELGWSCRSFENTIADTVSWLEQEGMLTAY